jgi:hypothetical protein
MHAFLQGKKGYPLKRSIANAVPNIMKAKPVRDKGSPGESLSLFAALILAGDRLCDISAVAPRGPAGAA